MKYTVKTQPQPSASFTLIPYKSDALPEDVKEQLSSLYHIPTSVLGGKHSQIISTPSSDGGLNSILLLPTTEKTGLQAYPSILGELKKYEASLQSKIQIELSLENEDLLPAVIRACELADYSTGLYQTAEKKPHPFQAKGAAATVILKADHVKESRGIIKEAVVLAKHQRAVMDLVNGPGNKVTPEYFAKAAVKMGAASGFKTTVFGKSRIEKSGLHALLAVNKGSEYLPRFLILEYKPTRKKGVKSLGLVGKGVTFDTGGLSIKGSQNMHYMKSDMGGAAAVLGTIAAAAELKWQIHLVGIIPLTDNCVDATSIKPGDVIRSYSGKTIEVINTDAEGRLILADGLAYLIKNFEMDHVIDLATLTGSCVRTFGDVCAGMFSNDEELAEQLFLSGLNTGEKLWTLPLWPDYDDQMESEIADIKNLSTKPVAGAITAAKFLEFFTLDHPSWAHLDIAGVAFGDTKFSKEKSATGFGVHLLADFIKDNMI